ncbi:hypothetical protein V6N13_014777 [Hibiscus sabdariffa]|uniref:Leucine-rich repeat-containing N-terminal plant-type domain-containing protein n=1 Tax=Hibiscus sabdariffa TaxID=183260 RepID=A0ABR2RWB6_9ROSI
MEKSHSLGCFLLVLCLFASLVSSQTSPDSPTMKKLKASLKISSSLDWSESDPCKWAHVACDNQRVIRIQILSQKIGGTLASDVKDLSELKIFKVMNNQIGGPIPSSAGLSQLQPVVAANPCRRRIVTIGARKMMSDIVLWRSWTVSVVNDPLRHCSELERTGIKFVKGKNRNRSDGSLGGQGIAIFSSDIFPMVKESRGLSTFEKPRPSSFPTRAVQPPSPPTPTPNNPTQDSFADGTRHGRYTP